MNPHLHGGDQGREHHPPHPPAQPNNVASAPMHHGDMADPLDVDHLVVAPEQAAHATHGDHHAHAGHAEHGGHSPEMFKSKFWLSVLLTLPILVWSEMIQEWLGYTAPEFPGSDLIPAVFGTVLFVYGGMVFLEGGWREIRDRTPGMMLLISL